MKQHRPINTAIALILCTAAMQACLLTDVQVPGPAENTTSYQFTSGDFEVLGTVEAEGEIETILGLVQLGGNGRSALYRKARDMGGHEVINYVFDLEGYAVLTFVYNRARWHARGTVIRYTDRVLSQDAWRDEQAGEERARGCL
ncbi:MAG: hypothetical protein H7A21_03935 [Spirochaetales bacterium]|nr:hypothetical protein [Leptospiraceae bacterium]MCP5480562.1 hypothetical protein [Spirochaetales bacterium]MCP5483912.1 hypothetical protein [Spirochaetales bacterium]